MWSRGRICLSQVARGRQGGQRGETTMAGNWSRRLMPDRLQAQNQLSGSCQLAFVVGLFLLLQLPLSILDEESSRDSTPPLPAMQEDDKKEEVTLLLCPHRHQSWLDFPFLKCPYFWQIENCSSSASPLASIYDVIGGCYSLHKLPWSLWGNYFLERLHQHPTYWQSNVSSLHISLLEKFGFKLWVSS